jgi:multidrug resistance efflux pump
MRRFLNMFGGCVITIGVTLTAGFVGWNLWDYYLRDPWTRDGRVQADVVGVAPDVSGLVSSVRIVDNQMVRQNDVLFVIDQARFGLALRQANAIVASRKATLDEAVREMNRYHSLTSLEVSREKQQQTEAAALESAAAYQQAVADRDTAQLNQDRSVVRAPVDGIIANFDLQPGNYVTIGKPVAALVDTHTLRVDGYFEETKLSRIRVDDRVIVHLMGEGRPVLGHVESVAAGIVDRERTGSDLLANINPTFNWVRLAQRIPVRVALDSVPPGTQLIVGRTATVTVLPRESSPRITRKQTPTGAPGLFDMG